MGATDPVNSQECRTWQFHAVLLYDLMGQSTKLRRLESLPPMEQPAGELIAALRETAGAVMTMRRHISSFYENAAISQMDVATLPPDARALFERSRAVSLAIRNFSDLTVAHTPLGERPGGPIPVASLAALFSAAVAMLLVSMAQGTPIRGAIDVGLAIDLDGDEIYGPILDEVYRSESTVAEWPRILVGASVEEYLNALSRDPRPILDVQIRVGLARFCLSLIGTDVDGRRIVDYLGVGARTHMGRELEFAVIERARAYAAGQKNMFTAEGNAKLAGRYAKVLAYMQKNVDTWRNA